MKKLYKQQKIRIHMNLLCKMKSNFKEMWVIEVNIYLVVKNKELI